MEELCIPLPSDISARFIDRPNRFVVVAELEDGKMEKAHLHDPGRLGEILRPRSRLLLKRAGREGRKTAFDVVAGGVGDRWVLINSSYHRRIAEAVLNDPETSPFGAIQSLKAEVAVGRSRLDFRIVDDRGDAIFMEVKGCSLTIDGRALFPDAPTERGKRHIQELKGLLEEGYRAAVMILVLGPPPGCFAPFEERDPGFAAAFRDGLEAGLEVYPLLFEYDRDLLVHKGEVPLCSEWRIIAGEPP
ncbi:MAG: DNA/RNA nuclease SfsA [Thermoplasmatota archaeon]